jgi:hypothetical protein
MEILNHSTLKLELNRFKRIVDISHFDGPLLVLFEDIKTKKLYLYDFVDRNKYSCRWLIYNIKLENLIEYLNGEITALDLYNKRNGTVFFSDIESGKDFNKCLAFELKEIPDNYIPCNVMSEPTDSTKLNEIMDKLKNI